MQFCAEAEQSSLLTQWIASLLFSPETMTDGVFRDMVVHVAKSARFVKQGERAMPWREVSVMDQRREFVMLAIAGGSERGGLCRRVRHQRADRLQVDTSGTKRAMRRWQTGRDDLIRVRNVQLLSTERQMSAARCAPGLGCAQASASLEARPASHSRDIDGARDFAPLRSGEGARGHAWTALYDASRRMRPNQLWQMDFKGHSALENGVSCHRLTTLDDHSRFSLCLAACDKRTRLDCTRTSGRRRSAATDCRMRCSSTMAAPGASLL